MKHIRMLGLALMAVFALGAVASSSASAIGWWVEEKPLETGKSEAISEATVTHVSRIRFHKKEIEIKCTEVTVQSGMITGPTANSAKSITFKKCKVEKPAGCEVAGGEIKTGEVESVLSGPPAMVEFKPKGGVVFAEFELVGAGCGVLAGEYAVGGSTKGEILNAEKCEKEHILKIKEEPSKLEVAEEKVELFEQEIGLTLISGKCFDAK